MSGLSEQDQPPTPSLLDVGARLRDEAKTRWLHPDELYLILVHAPHEMGFSVEYEVSQTPKGKCMSVSVSTACLSVCRSIYIHTSCYRSFSRSLFQLIC